MAKASDLFIETLEAEGVEYIFGIPGEENLDFLDSLSRSEKIKLILIKNLPTYSRTQPSKLIILLELITSL